MKQPAIATGILLPALLLSSCFKEIDTEPMERTVEETFTVQHSIRKIQSYHWFYENAVVEVDTAGTRWDLAFESAGDGYRVLLGWASYSTGVPTGIFDFGDPALTQELVLDLKENSDDWVFDDPSFVNTPDSMALTGHWENGEIWIQNRGVSDDNYYAIQYVSSTETSYTFRYASARSLDQVRTATVNRSSGFNYVYYSYDSHSVVQVEPPSRDWDLLFTPYRSWWETSTPGIYAPFNLSGVLINNEAGVRVARIDSAEILYEDLDFSSVDRFGFSDKKGIIGADWKVLGDQTSGNIYSMDPDKKYLLKKYDPETDRIMYFKLQIVDYKLNGEDHHPTVEFKFLGSE